MSETSDAPAAAPQEKSPVDRAIDALMALVATRGWRHVTPVDVATDAGLSLAQLYALFPTKTKILAGFVRRIDEATFAARPEGEGKVRDKLFDLLMRRFEALKPYRPALKELARAGLRDGALPLAMGPRFLNAMRWIADAAGVSTAGLLGVVRVKALAAAYLWTFRVFLDDDSEDLARTMAALDRALARCESVAQSLPGGRRRAASA
jgi:AcrR family transcriptional regulator